MAANFYINVADLEFILKQIRIAEQHAATGELKNLDGTPISPLLPAGLRTVDGTYNSLLPGQSDLGAADQVMPRMLTPEFLNEADGDSMPLGPGAPVIVNTDYNSHQSVADADPRIISNLISDQTLENFSAVFKALELAGSSDPMADAALIAADADPLAKAAELGLDITANGSITIENLSPDIGLSPSFNGWMTLFGQFFDHGLDLIPKGGNGTVYIPLQPDDPLYDPTPGAPNFMALTRAATVTTAGADGVLGTADDQTHETINTTTPFVDQNQTYTSHASHQVFLREYKMVDGKPAATGHLLDGANGGIANWGEVKAQAREMLGIELNDFDIGNVPLLRTDPYGKFIPADNGFAQVIVGIGADGVANTEDDLVLVGTPDSPVGTAAALRTGHAFLDDIAHHAAPGVYDHDGNPMTAKVAQVADADTDSTVDDGDASTYDNELLDRHYITGDGRGNENIGLTAVHTVFHAEHNRLVEDYKHTILESGNLAFINEWLLTDLASLDDVPTTETDIAGLNWDGERLFQAGRFVTEMEYQHLVFEEFGRKVQPAIDPFVFSASPDLDPAIVAEFAHVVYRFGHSMLRETVDRLDIANEVVNGEHIGLIEAFLNPVEFDQDGAVSAAEAAGQIIRGMTRQAGNEIDEFLTEALRNNLVGLPLDLGALNIARGRDTGVPSLNHAREQFYEMTGDSRLTPYTSWIDFATHIKNPLSIVNFIAAYGTHDTITAAVTLEEKRDAAMLLVTGGEGAPADSIDFLSATGEYAGGSLGGLNAVDFWIGGLAEEKQEFGGMLGGTFNFVFETQMEALQNGDRFYYLSRTQGMNLLNELEANSFTKLVMRNTDLGQPGQGHLPGILFDTPDRILEIIKAVQIGDDPTHGNLILDLIKPLFIRRDTDNDGDSDFLQYNGGEHVVLGGSEETDTLIGGLGIDTLWGDGGNDRLDGGYEADKVHGGDGDDIITNLGGDDFLFGDDGNDVISMGSGVVLGFGGRGKDFIMTGPDTQEVFAGEGDDFVLGGNGGDFLLGNEGDDWLEGGEGFDSLAGENSELFFDSPIIGHDVLNGQGNDTDYDGESGDDIMVQGAGIQRSNGMFGFDWAIHKGDAVAANSDLGIPFFPGAPEFTLRDRFDSVEGLSGWNLDDTLTGQATMVLGARPGTPADQNHLKAKNVGLIDGLAELLGYSDAQIAELDPNFSVVEANFANETDPGGAEIIIGGGGSDIIKGNLGNDILDGDAWLNVRIAVSGHPTITSVDSMNEIKSRLLSGEINPSQLSIVREILQSTSAETDLDTAVYNGNRADYTVVRNADDSYTVTHANVLAGVVNDGSDTIRNFEFLRFADQDVDLRNAAPVISSNGGGDAAALAFAENVLAAVTTMTATDADPDDTLVYSISGGADAALFAIDENSGVLSFVDTPNFESAGDADTDNVYDVIVAVSDGVAVDTQALAITVTNVNEAATGELHIASYTTAANASASLTASNTIADPDLPSMVPTYQWQRLQAGNWVAVAGATGATLAAQSNVTLRVTSTYTDPFGSNTVVSAETAVVGSGAANNLTGTAGNDFVLGLGGNDTLTAGAGNDTVDGGVGNDTFWAGVNDGNDVYIGGVGTDTYNLSLTSVAADVNLTAGTASSAQIGNDTLSSIENVVGGSGANVITDAAGVANTLNGGGGNDTFVLVGDNVRDVIVGASGTDTVDYSSATANLTVNLGAGATVTVVGSGSSNASSDTVNGVENVIGGSGNDSITGTAQANALTGGFGNDVLNGGGGSDTLDGGEGNDTLVGGQGNDILTGGAGADVFDYNNVVPLLTTLGDSGVGVGNRDIVMDFISGLDKLDFSSIDANAGSGGDQAFSAMTLVAGSGGFTGAGQLHYFYETVAGEEYTVLEGNTGGLLGDLPDFQVALLGHINLQAADVLL